MSVGPEFVTTGTESDKIDVRLSYRIVRLFSEGLYASPNKAIEELVANSFDAGAHSVAVLLPADFHEQNASIAIIDDGEGMDAEGLRHHWLIGKSLKRDLASLPLGRQQIGKFGIGKLATYVLANRLTHISKRGGKYYSTSMNFRAVDERGDEDVEPKAPIKIALRVLTEAEAKAALEDWTSLAGFTKSGVKLFGAGAAKSWTFAILSDLKDKVHEIRRGRLQWVLRTALPLRDDFAIYLNGEKLEPSKAGKGRIKRWLLGKEIKILPKPALDEVEPSEDESQTDAELRFGLDHPSLGRMTGYAEAYKDLLTGKSDDIARSHGFFVYVRGRLINVEDGHFGISPNELRHGTFGRIRVVINMDGLDAYLQSDRERVREGPVLTDAQNVLRAIFNWLRPHLEKADAEDEPGAQLARKMGGRSCWSSTSSLVRASTELRICYAAGMNLGDELPPHIDAFRVLLGELYDDLPQRVERLRLLTALDQDFGGAGVMIPGGEGTYRAYIEARSNFVNGNYLAVILLSQALIETLLGAQIELEQNSLEIHGRPVGKPLSRRPSFDEIIRKGLSIGLLDASDEPALQRVRSMRNPLTHYRDINDPTNMTRRVLNEMTHAMTLLEADARFCITTVIRLLSKPTFAIGRSTEAA